MTNLINNTINKRMNQLNNEFMNEIGETAIAIRELNIPSKGQPKGHYLRSYKNAYEILKPILGDYIKWDASLRGRDEIK